MSTGLRPTSSGMKKSPSSSTSSLSSSASSPSSPISTQQSSTGDKEFKLEKKSTLQIKIQAIEDDNVIDFDDLEDIKLAKFNNSDKSTMSAMHEEHKPVNSAYMESMLMAQASPMYMSQENLRDSMERRHSLKNSSGSLTGAGFKTIVISISLLCLGLFFFFFGLSLWLSAENQEGLDMLIIGGVMLMPGSYGCISLYGSFKGWQGYGYIYLPSFDL